MNPALVLASSSPRRRDLLARIGAVPARQAAPDIDEEPRPNELPRVYALRLAVEKAQAAVRAAVIGVDGLALGEITYPHRSFGTLDLYQWIVFTATHEMRHILQIREIGAALKTATPS